MQAPRMRNDGEEEDWHCIVLCCIICGTQYCIVLQSNVCIASEGLLAQRRDAWRIMALRTGWLHSVGGSGDGLGTWPD